MRCLAAKNGMIMRIIFGFLFFTSIFFYYGKNVHSREDEKPALEEGQCSAEQKENPCPLDMPLTKKDLGCSCGIDVLQKRHFRTLMLISNTKAVLMCQENKAIKVKFNPRYRN
ncbi:MAG: hypothetical protein ACXAC5_23850 [Promethearchaeota archaeon]|jgi:hypothetical protein